MHTPWFPQFRARFANLGHRVHQIRQQSLLQLDLLLSPWLPAGLLSQADEGPNSRERVYSVRRTFFGFLFQVLKPGKGSEMNIDVFWFARHPLRPCLENCASNTKMRSTT
jgi:hypothetical protein